MAEWRYVNGKAKLSPVPIAGGTHALPPDFTVEAERDGARATIHAQAEDGRMHIKDVCVRGDSVTWDVLRTLPLREFVAKAALRHLMRVEWHEKGATTTPVEKPSKDDARALRTVIPWLKVKP